MVRPMSACPYINLIDPQTYREGMPYGELKKIRDAGAVVRLEEPLTGVPYWVITRQKELDFVSKNPTLFSSAARSPFPMEFDEQINEHVHRKTIIGMDPPEHQLVRRIVRNAFTPSHVAACEPALRQHAKRIVDAVAKRGECEFVEEVAAELPLTAILDLLGVPLADRKKFFDWTNTMIFADDPDMCVSEEAGHGAAAEVIAYAMQLAARYYEEQGQAREEHGREQGGSEEPGRKQPENAQQEAQEQRGRRQVGGRHGDPQQSAAQDKNNPGESLLGALLEGEVKGRRISEEEFGWMFILILVGGNESTRTVIAHGMRLLMENPEQLQYLVDNPGKIPDACEEMLRYNTAFIAMRRTAMQDTELGGQQIAKGDKLLLHYHTINHDETVFSEDAMRFDVRRAERQPDLPNQLRSFGIGQHFCLGSHLARLELRIMMEEIIPRLRNPRFASPPKYVQSFFVNAIKEMKITFDPE